MGFTEREVFIQIMTVMVVSNIARSIPRDIRASLIMLMRDSACPTVSNAEWGEISHDINKNNEQILGTLAKSLKDSKDPKKVMEKATLLALDRAVQDNLKDIDFDKLDMTDAPQEVLDWLKSKKDLV
tara:strand:+ start:46 stop:426 length:381 start_codon:yes stop_codon:yes gene_type:complete